MITDQDIEVAKRISTKWRSNAVFSSEDAFQEMMLKVLQSKVSPDRTRMRGHVMRGAAISRSVESSYLMRIPYTSYSVNGAPAHIKHTGLSLSEPWPLNVPEENLAQSDTGFKRVEERAVVSQLMERLPGKDREVVWRWANNPSSVTSGGDRRILRRSIAKLQQILQGDE